MKPYGRTKRKRLSKREKRGDGCFLCTGVTKATKNAVRQKAKLSVRPYKLTNKRNSV